MPDRRQDADDEILAAFVRYLKAEVGDDAVKLLTAKMEDDLSQRDVIRHPEFKKMGEWRIRRLMAKIRDAAKAFAERQGDDAILAAINRLTRTGRRAGGRGWPRKRVEKESHKNRRGRRGRSPGRPYCNPISGFSRMLHGIGNTPNAVKDNVQVRAAKGSHHLPNPWPWPT